jgi:hypothetical protein
LAEPIELTTAVQEIRDWQAMRRERLHQNLVPKMARSDPDPSQANTGADQWTPKREISAPQAGAPFGKQSRKSLQLPLNE